MLMLLQDEGGFASRCQNDNMKRIVKVTHVTNK
jgi:hypothetical protein